MSEALKKVTIKPFAPKTDVKIAANEKEAKALEEDKAASTDYDQVVKALLASIPERSTFNGWTMNRIEFEKDNPTNLHLDFVTACSNLRARNYKITEANMHQTKFIAGKIIPAIATTTALVTGLVCLELYKLVQGKHIADFRNTYANLAIPIFSSSEPMNTETKTCTLKDKGDWKWTLWDQLDVDIGDVTLQQFLDHMEDKHGLIVQSVVVGDASIYSDMSASKKKKLSKKLSKLVMAVSDVKPSDLYINFVIIACDQNDKDQELPPIRFKFRNQPGKKKEKKEKEKEQS